MATVPAASAARAADESAVRSSSTADACLAGAASNVMDLMMRLSNVKARAVAANKAALEAEQAKDALEREIQALERAIKRPRTEASSTARAWAVVWHSRFWVGLHSGARLYSLNTDSLEGGQVYCGGSSRYQAAQRSGG